MSDTIVLQSHRNPLPFEWISPCLDSVRAWATANRFEYRYLEDELFDFIDPQLVNKTIGQPVITSDLARLRWCQSVLNEGYRRVVWLDADNLIFYPEKFVLPEDDFAVGREVWVQQDNQGNCKVYKKVHNACLTFCQGNSFLDFYADSAERLLRLNTGGMPPQFIGPKLLTALHNIVQCPVIENAAMFSPLLMQEMLNKRSEAFKLFVKSSLQMPVVANLCASLGLAEQESETSRLIQFLIDNPAFFES